MCAAKKNCDLVGRHPDYHSLFPRAQVCKDAELDNRKLGIDLPTAGAIPPTDAGPGTFPATAAACAACAACDVAACCCIWWWHCRKSNTYKQMYAHFIKSGLS